MAPDFEPLASVSFDKGDEPSLVERVFDNPENVSQGEYWAIHEFLLDPDIRDDPEMIASVLLEFEGWAKHMLERMHKLGLIGKEETHD